MKSGRGDSNPWPQRPERCALTRLRYAPVSPVNYNEKRIKIKAQKKIRQEWIQKRDENLHVKFNNVFTIEGTVTKKGGQTSMLSN